MNPLRRAFLIGPALAWGHRAWATPTVSPMAPRALRFPQDHGAHTAQRTEWWYLTGQLWPTGSASGTVRFGFQVTFFRSRVDTAQALPGRLAARQLLFAHGAVTDLQARQLRHDQRIARWNGDSAPLNPPRPQAWASQDDTEVAVGGWHMHRQPESGVYQTQVQGDDFSLQLAARPTQSLLLQGADGWSRKGPDTAQASHYYTQPQLAVQGQMTLDRQTLNVEGRAWLDHEWSEALLHPEAVGWDWIGMNLANGGSLTAFRLRRADGSALWAGGSWRDARDAQSPRPTQVFAPGDVAMAPLRWWQSPATGTRYPVEWRVRTPVGEHTVHALLDAQELDSRASTGTVYWEGLSELRDGRGGRHSHGERLGLGYLELTGYGGALRL